MQWANPCPLSLDGDKGMKQIEQEIYNDGSRSIVARAEVPDDAVLVTPPLSGQMAWAMNSGTSRRLECKDIPDDLFLAAIDQTEPITKCWRERGVVGRTLESLLGQPIPDKLTLAKARKLIDRDILHGCPCGCIGNWHRPSLDRSGRRECC